MIFICAFAQVLFCELSFTCLCDYTDVLQKFNEYASGIKQRTACIKFHEYKL